MLTLNKHIILSLLIILISSSLLAQPIEKEFGYFIFPIKPGVRNTLAGTMGELRSSHFHTGIDIRTGGQQGLAVLAAADGYITRVRVSGGGYGYTLYVLHPNGKTTVYAHLKSFRSDIEEYIKEAQYKNESFDVNLFPKPNQFKVTQGDTIALSGNTGSSGGPHLHFDIRDENQNLLNPLSYGFDEVIDTRKPFAKSVALVPFTETSRIEGSFDREEFELNSTSNGYEIKDTLNALGLIGLELYAWDRMDGTRFKTGINKIEVTANNEVIFSQKIDTWSFSRARAFYQYINYETLISTGKRFHKLYIDNGNTLRFYTSTPTKGKLNIVEGDYYNIKVAMEDSYGNVSESFLTIYGSSEGNKDKSPAYTLSTYRNTLQITGDSTSHGNARLIFGEESSELSNAYTNAMGLPVYLWDLRDGIPDEIVFGDTAIKTSLISLVPSGKEYSVFNESTDVFFTRNSLFDSLAFALSQQKDTIRNLNITSIGDPNIPIKGSVRVVFKPSELPAYKEKSAVYQVYGKANYSYAGGNWKDDHIETSLRSFGNFTILTDSVAPTIKPLIVNRNQIVFRLDDDLSGIKEVRATLNGKWLLIASDPKRKQYWAEKHYASDNYSGDFIMEVIDNANNIKTYTTKIN